MATGNVFLNEAALRSMLDDEQGPVGLMLRRTVLVIEENEEAVIEQIFSNAFIRPKVQALVETGDEGLVGVVDITAGGNVSDYFADKMGREGWIVPAIMQNWDSQISPGN